MGRAFGLALVAVAFGCNAIAGIDDLRPNDAVSSSAAATSGTGGSGGARDAVSSSSVGGAGGKPSLCTTQYGDVSGFMLCPGEGIDCVFYAHVQPHTCASLCAARGGECLRVFNNANDVPTCMSAEAQSCNDATLVDAICVCSLGCGQEPPCTPDQTCSGGMCH